MNSTADGFVHPEFLIETDELERRLGDSDLRILDCTTHLIPDPKITYQVVPGRQISKRGTSPARNLWTCRLISRTTAIAFGS